MTNFADFDPRQSWSADPRKERDIALYHRGMAALQKPAGLASLRRHGRSHIVGIQHAALEDDINLHGAMANPNLQSLL